MCHSTKCAGVFDNVNVGCIPLRGDPGIVRPCSLEQCTGTLEGTEPLLLITFVLFLLWWVKMSAVKKAYDESSQFQQRHWGTINHSPEKRSNQAKISENTCEGETLACNTFKIRLHAGCAAFCSCGHPQLSFHVLWFYHLILINHCHHIPSGYCHTSFLHLHIHSQPQWVSPEVLMLPLYPADGSTGTQIQRRQ